MKGDDLSIGEIRKLFDYDFASGALTWRTGQRKVKTGAIVGHVTDKGYRRCKIAGCEVMVHRLVFAYCLGRWPLHQIDHKNGNRDDNRIENLREATTCENNRNRKPRRGGYSGVLGVCWSNQESSWRVSINKRYLGYRKSLIDAVALRLSAEREIHGPFGAFGRPR